MLDCVLLHLHPEDDAVKLLVILQNTAELVSEQRVTAAFHNVSLPLVQHCAQAEGRSFILRGSQT